jgi:A/G-specific adenine glycosylase
LGVEVEIIKKITAVRHAYSHFKIVMSVFLCRLKGREAGELRPPAGLPFRWITIDELDDYPFPGANHKFFPLLKTFFKSF